MYIKKFFFALPVALLAVFFTFCTKEQQAPITEALPQADGTVGDRACCDVTVTINNGGTIALCGVQNSLVACGNVGGNVIRGTDQWAGPGARTYTLCWPNTATGTFFQISAPPTQTAVSVTVSTPNGSVGPFNVGGGFGIKTVAVTNGCLVF